tara:strand:+ start:2925 stop:4601 length:1677 start_codon:yes stop_codon:yes gene_type:complete
MNVSKYLLSTLLLSIFLFVACDESEDIQRYEQEVLTTANNPLTYTNLTSYPIVGPIDSTTPNGDFDTPYRYRLLNATSSTGSSFTKASFSIEVNTGFIRYNNTANTITPGVYVLDVGVTNSNGMAVHEGAYELTILEVPIQVDIDAVQVDAGIFEQGVMATVSYTDTSASGSEVTSVSYALVEPPAGFTINATTGAISKVNGAVSGPNQLTVRVTTNTGIVIKENILTVVVGPPPTLQMVQQDDTTALTKAVVSPNTAYTTAAPVINGMSPTEWEIVFPKSLVNSDPDVSLGETVIDFSSSFGVEEPSGKISIAADADLPSGMHTLSLKATNATANEYIFEDVFTIEVEDRWGTVIYEPSDFDAFTGVTLHHLDSPTNFLITANNHGMAKMPLVRWQSVNGAGNLNRIDAAMELKVPILDPSIRKARISFYEASGYNNSYVTRHERKVYSYQSADTTPPTADPSTWNLMIDNDDSMWSTIAQWPDLKDARDITNTAPDITLFNKMGDETTIVSVSSDTQNLYFFLRLEKVSDQFPTQGQWLIADFMVEASKAFAAEEY